MFETSSTATPSDQLIKAARAELRYLPPYSPDMNPIEKAYSKLKTSLRKIAERTVVGLLIALDAREQKAVAFKNASVSQDTTVDGDHGRIESRMITVFHDIGRLQANHQWPGL